MNHVNTQWLRMARAVYHQPNYVCAPRGMEIRERLGYTSIVDMNQPILNIAERKLNYAFLFGEAEWILSGSNRVRDIAPTLPGIAKFSDNGETFRGAYGPKVVEQLDYVVDMLKQDEHTRQAVLTIWRENPRPSRDIPCTIAMQFFIRDNALHCQVFMRSSDAFLGWGYDVFNFSMISLYVLAELKKHASAGSPPLRLGVLRLTAGSQHIYARDYEVIRAILDVPAINMAFSPALVINTEYLTDGPDVLETLAHMRYDAMNDKHAISDDALLKHKLFIAYK